ncbi:MAG: hypothetical protein DWQ04_03340 [Chloroflexi bacterium]|nr:MAG: hypothetical protein DWQ04_03340 [Chloroflexota bacterium]
MAHIVFMTYGITSYLNTSFAVAAGLRARGHRVTYVSSLDVETAVTTQGFNFMLLADEARIRQDPERLQLERLPGRQRYQQRDALIRVGQRQRDYYLESDEWSRMLEVLQPDVLCIDEELPEAIIRLSSHSIPMLLVQYIGDTRYRPGLPPASSHLVPDGSLQSRVKIQVEWLKLWAKRGLTHLLAPLFYAGTDRRSIIRALAKQVGFDYGRAAFHHWFPMTFPDIPTLILAAPVFDFAPPPQVDGAYVGPMVWSDRVDAVDEGTSAAVEAFLQRVVAAFRQRPEWDLVLASGVETAVSHFEPIPENVLVCERVPQLRLLEQADVVLTHGGIGTINECITYGVPMITYSTGKMEQNGSAARVEFHEMGLRSAIDDTPAEAIAAQIAHVLSNPHYRANVTKMQALYQQYHAENRAVEHIETVLHEDGSGV